MAKQVNAGDLRTRIRVYKLTRTVNDNGFESETTQNVFGDGVSVYCRWIWAHGSEVFEHRTLELGQVATLTMYASPLITPQCRIELVDDAAINGEAAGMFEIISIDQVENQLRYMEIKVKREVIA